MKPGRWIERWSLGPARGWKARARPRQLTGSELPRPRSTIISASLCAEIRGGSRSMPGLLRQPSFALLWTAGLISQIGDWLLVLSLPLYVYQQSGSSLATGATFAAGLLPRIVVGSLAGV